MITPLLADETLQKLEVANIQRGWETVGGKLALTNRRLIFESHPFNIHTGTTEIHLPDIVCVQVCWTKFLNLFPIYPNSIAVTTKNGKEYRLVVKGRSAWIDEIRKRAMLPGSARNDDRNH